MITGVFRWIVVKAIFGTIVALVSAPTRFARWLKCHPMNRAIVIDITMYFVFIFGLPTALFFLGPHVGIEGNSNCMALAFLGIIVAMGGWAVYRLRHNVSKNGELGELGQFYRNWEILSRYGSVGFLLYTVAMQVRYTIGFAIFCAVAVPWFFVIAFVGVIGAYPLGITIAIAHGFYKIASRSGHLLCFGITVFVTSISWFTYHESFGDQRILWIVALATGIVSGGVTEFIRRIGLMFYEVTPIGRWFATHKSFDFIVDCDEDRGYMGVVMFKFGGTWFRHNRLARMFRAICFDTPVVRPVLIVD